MPPLLLGPTPATLATLATLPTFSPLLFGATTETVASNLSSATASCFAKVRTALTLNPSFRETFDEAVRLARIDRIDALIRVKASILLQAPRGAQLAFTDR